MVTPKLDCKAPQPCDVCNAQTALLYCRADSANLCLLCDHHVHSANLLSLKHLRSRICDNCCAEPVSVRCATDNLVLCQECDYDAHGTCSVSAAHDRIPVNGFSGCPSALELASIWGFDLQEEKPPDQMWNQELTMPAEEAWLNKTSVRDLMEPYEQTVLKKKNHGSGKYKQVWYKQLVELMKRNLMADVVDDDGGGRGGEIEDLVQNVEANDNVLAPLEIMQPQQQMQTPFTSLLMMQTPESNHIVDGGDVLWNGNPTDQTPQIWDFKSEELWGDEPQFEEDGYGGSDAAVFMIKNFMDETSLSAKLLGDACHLNYTPSQDNMDSINVLFLNQFTVSYKYPFSYKCKILRQRINYIKSLRQF
ncbi:Detected protein of unknown function [Hibiscus syriacus]|uniref:B box-type domain-containing protein n=1 Tax=Hibiscus syriacus TaxID=106335 RepID=A0A6A3CSU9_HIBSY|nr:Detected protein of unknown function [Hibiscus syriacus]